MTEQFTLEELQHMMIAMNYISYQDDCPICSSARQKIAAMILKKQEIPVIEHRDYSGIPATVEHLKG